jgi:hypothetical protein
MSMDEPVPREGRGIGIYLLLCATAALWADLGTLHRLQHGDSLLPVLVSLQRWTPFFWEQDRYGMLIPLLARPVRSPFGNLLLQGFLNVSCGLSTFFLLARYMVRDWTYAIVGAVGAATFLVLAPALYRFDYLMDANYGVWMTLGLGGLLVLAGPGGGTTSWARRLVALVLIMLAHWVYLATALYLVPLVVFRALLAPGFFREAWRGLRPSSLSREELAEVAGRVARSEACQASVLLCLGFFVGIELTELTPHHQTSFTTLPMGEWPGAWASLVEQTWRALAPGGWPLTLGVGAVVVVSWCLAGGVERRASIPWREATALVATAIVVALFLGTKRWLKINLYVPRYLLPSVLLTQAALSMLIVVPLCRRVELIGVRRKLPVLIGFLLLASVATAYGLPSPRRVRDDLERFGGMTADVLEAGCTHIAGDYWTVWPAVFHANLTLYERGQSRTVWAATFRAQPASKLWWDTPQAERCACIPAGDPFGENWLISFGFHGFRDVERRPTIRVLRRRVEPPGDTPNP